MDTALTRSQFVRWRTAIFAIFLASGLSIATWASRVPGIKEALDLDNAQVGLILLGMGVASILGISTSPAVMARTGARRGMLLAMLTFASGIALVGLGATVFGSVPVVLIGMVLFGFGNGCVDVMMNVEATAIEQQMGRTILPVFHAFFSFGTVLGAGIGALAAALKVDVGTHAVSMGVLIAVIAVVCFFQVPVREAALDPEDHEEPPFRQRMHTALEAWREPRTYLLGTVMLGMSFAEGGANDWIALGTEQGHGFAEGTGAVALAVFSVGMTVVRLFGGPLVDRFGRVLVLRILAATAATGILLFILAPTLPLVLVGAALWGIGASLGFPLGMSAAADDPAKAAARVSAAATIGYVAFLGGPPVLGVISEHIGLLNTLFILVALVVLSGLFSGAARPLRAEEKAPAVPTVEC
ncbi:MFS transporter [Microbacterium sp.]|uniref:MFS transporter n=1 Tax=Microbacterium sp. TaxID=51671 RepID=UPI00289C5DC2|nr:MFS transporter [Microbacterium sp.]